MGCVRCSRQGNGVELMVVVVVMVVLKDFLIDLSEEVWVIGMVRGDTGCTKGHIFRWVRDRERSLREF